MSNRTDELGPELESRLGEPFDRVVHDPALRDPVAFDRHYRRELELAFQPLRARRRGADRARGVRRVSARVTISAGAAALLRELAQREDVSQRVFLEALLHYAGSIYRRPGSWEASKPFEFFDYDDRSAGLDTPNGCAGCADRWFDDARQYAFGEGRE